MTGHLRLGGVAGAGMSKEGAKVMVPKAADLLRDDATDLAEPGSCSGKHDLDQGLGSEVFTCAIGHLHRSSHSLHLGAPACGQTVIADASGYLL